MKPVPSLKPGATFWKSVCHPRPVRARLGVTNWSATGLASSTVHLQSLLSLEVARFQPSPSPQQGELRLNPAEGAGRATRRRPPPCSSRKQWLPEGERAALSEDSDVLLELPELGFGLSRSWARTGRGQHRRSQHVLFGTALTVARAPAAPPATTQKQAPPPCRSGPTRNPEEEARAEPRVEKGDGDRVRNQAQYPHGPALVPLRPVTSTSLYQTDGH